MSVIRYLLIFLPFITVAQNDPVVFSVYCIGNTGLDTIPSAAVQLMAFESFDDSLSSIVFAGNISGKDLKKASFEQRKKIMNAQYSLFTAYRGQLAILPGEAEWNGARRFGRITNEQCRNYSNAWLTENSIVKNSTSGCYQEGPAPELHELRKGLCLITFDSQWWLQNGRITFNRKKQKQQLARFDSLLSKAHEQQQQILVASHHPLISNGKHIHHKQPLRFLMNYSPLKIFSLFGADRALRQDLNQPRYNRYRSGIQSIIQKYPGLIFIAAHEYNMQYIKTKGVHHIISGSGAEVRSIDRYRYQARFMDDLQPGFFRITFHRSGNVYLHAYGAKDRGEYWKTLMFTHPKTFE